MPETVLDCKGMPCPKPVLECRAFLDEQHPARLAVLVDNEAAKENVSRFLTSRGYSVSTLAENQGLWRVSGVLSTPAAEAPEECRIMSGAELGEQAQQVAVFITSATIGHGDDVLGAKLMKNFLATLPELGTELWRIMLVNGGVKLAVAGSPVLEELRSIEKRGVSILVCGACLDHFGLLSSKEVGQTTNMLDIVTSMQLASKVLQI